MPVQTRRRRRSPKDEELLRHATDPGFTRAIAIGLAFLAVFGAGIYLLVQGLG